MKDLELIISKPPNSFDLIATSLFIVFSDEKFADVRAHPPEDMALGEVEVDGEEETEKTTENTNKTAENGAAVSFDRNSPSRVSFFFSKEFKIRMLRLKVLIW